MNRLQELGVLLEKYCDTRNEYVGLKNNSIYAQTERFYEGLIEEYDEIIRDIQRIIGG